MRHKQKRPEDEQNQFCNYYDYFLYNFIILLKTLVRTQTFVGFTLPHIKNFILFFVVYDQQRKVYMKLNIFLLLTAERHLRVGLVS